MAQLLPGTVKIAELPGQLPRLQQAVQQLTHLVLLLPDGPADISVVAQQDNCVLRRIIQRCSKRRVDQRHITVRRREILTVFQALSVLPQSLQQRFIGMTPALLPGDQRF